jgi:hypothetical protein
LLTDGRRQTARRGGRQTVDGGPTEKFFSSKISFLSIKSSRDQYFHYNRK